MRILGIDPGIATTGFGVIETTDHYDYQMLDYGCIKTESRFIFSERLQQIYKDMQILLKKWRPTAIAIEELFFNKNVKTAITVAQARGAMMQQFAVAKYEIAEYKPQQIKEAVCGYGKAEKKQLQKMVQLILKLPYMPTPDDAADALAVAICHANSMKFHHLTSGGNLRFPPGTPRQASEPPPPSHVFKREPTRPA